MRRSLPSSAEALAILAARRPRPAPRPPRHAARGLTSAMKKLEEKFGAVGPDDLRSRWKEIVGEALAGRTEPVKLIRARNGGATLELRVAGPVAALVQHQAPLILDRLNLYLGPGTVVKLRIVQGPLSRPSSPAKSAPKRRSRAPLDAAAERELAASLAETPDGPLKDALLRLGREVLRSTPSLPLVGRDRPRSGPGGDV